MAHYRRLGSSGLRISVPVFGAMSIGHKDWQPWVVDGDEALELLKAAWDRGINTFDTANVYSNGVSEELLGQFTRCPQKSRDSGAYSNCILSRSRQQLQES